MGPNSGSFEGCPWRSIQGCLNSNFPPSAAHQSILLFSGFEGKVWCIFLIPPNPEFHCDLHFCLCNNGGQIGRLIKRGLEFEIYLYLATDLHRHVSLQSFL